MRGASNNGVNVSARLALWGFIVMLLLLSPLGQFHGYMLWAGAYLLFLLVFPKVRWVYWFIFFILVLLMPVIGLTPTQSIANTILFFVRDNHHSGMVHVVRSCARSVAVLGFISFSTKLLEECLWRPIWLWGYSLVVESGLLFIDSVRSGPATSYVILMIVLSFVMLAMAHEQVQRLSSRMLYATPVLTHMIRLTIIMTLFTLTGLLIPPIMTTVVPNNWLDQEQKSTHEQNVLPTDGLRVTHLGGPFTGTHHIVLRVFAHEPSYYLGEVFNQFNGDGWTNPASSEIAYQYGQVYTTKLSSSPAFMGGMTTHRLRQTVEVVAGHYSMVFGAYQIATITSSTNGFEYHYLPSGDAFSLGDIGPGTTYTVTSDVPTPNIQLLKNVHDGNLAYALPDDLQLPLGLPNRDILLAQYLTQGVHGTYQKVMAIIQYLRTHEHYATQHIPETKPGQDFVDQFLFETHRGYCDQFASALTILARSIGIPARYAVGFVEVPSTKSDHGLHEYVLRGTDAHAWTQIWFAGYGFVSFDATPPTSLPVNQIALTKSVDTQDVTGRLASPDGERVVTQHIFYGFTASQWRLTLVLVVGSTVVFGLILFLFVRKIGGKLYKKRVVSMQERIGQDSCADLFATLYQTYGPRPCSQTLREYVREHVDSDHVTYWMQIVQQYERICYGKEHHD
ncbi:transglutaminase domain-containing protein [Sulfoacidibacillus ferrooxidans]|uniref:Transglutaminase-like domain-containing protein n=1 Tax=Sulfoacidibacillus ferrooxidans TaxID=2005001 RepID=A0A9X2ACU1_9BACL|nr:hypothetical protein [Sulfoacidibacillus ferrooxidans]